MSLKLFTRECVVCRWTGEELLEDAMVPHLCPKCGSDTVWRPGRPALIFFKEGWYEHIGEDPLYISSMQQLRDQCAANGVYSEYAEDSSVHRSSRHKEI